MVILASALIGVHAVLGQNLAERLDVGVGDQSPAAFAAVAVGGADGVAAGAGDRAEAGLPPLVHAHILLQLALNAHRVVRQAGRATLQQRRHHLEELPAVDRASGDGGVDLDHGADRARRIGFVPIRLVAVDVAPYLIQVLSIADGVDAAQMGARAERNHQGRLLADLAQHGFVAFPRARALDEGDLVVVALLAHGLAESDNVNHLEKLRMGLQGVDDGKLAALAAREFEERDFGSGAHHSASSRCLISA